MREGGGRKRDGEEEREGGGRERDGEGEMGREGERTIRARVVGYLMTQLKITVKKDGGRVRYVS